MGGGDYTNLARMEDCAVTAFIHEALSNPGGFFIASADSHALRFITSTPYRFVAWFPPWLSYPKAVP